MKMERLVLVVLVILGISFLVLHNRIEQTSDNSNPIDEVSERTQIAEEDCTPTFPGGGGPNYLANTPFREKIVPEDAGGDKLIVEGRVLYNDCETPIAGAVVDIWQADAAGEYRDDWYRGRVRADEEGYYRFETVIPQGYGSGTGYRPPHIHFKVHLDDRELITSQMFFPEARGREGFDDAYIMELEEQTDDSGEIVFNGYHDIVIPTSPGEI